MTYFAVMRKLCKLVGRGEVVDAGDGEGGQDRVADEVRSDAWGRRLAQSSREPTSWLISHTNMRRPRQGRRRSLRSNAALIYNRRSHARNRAKTPHLRRGRCRHSAAIPAPQPPAGDAASHPGRLQGKCRAAAEGQTRRRHDADIA